MSKRARDILIDLSILNRWDAMYHSGNLILIIGNYMNCLNVGKTIISYK